MTKKALILVSLCYLWRPPTLIHALAVKKPLQLLLLVVFAAETYDNRHPRTLSLIIQAILIIVIILSYYSNTLYSFSNSIQSQFKNRVIRAFRELLPYGTRSAELFICVVSSSFFMKCNSLTEFSHSCS
jgi:hypothetical protein